MSLLTANLLSLTTQLTGQTERRAVLVRILLLIGALYTVQVEEESQWKIAYKLGVVVHDFQSQYLGSRGRQISVSSRPAWSTK